MTKTAILISNFDNERF